MALDFRKWQASEMKRRPRRTHTRWVLAGGLAMLALLPVVQMLSPEVRAGVFPNVMPFALLLIVGSAQSPFTRDTIFTDRGLGQYDEFERAALTTALRRSYLAVLILIGGVFLWLMAGARLGWPLPTLPRQWGALGFTMVMIMLALPATLAEFTVPMPDPEDEML